MQFIQRVAGLRDGVDGDFGSETRGGENCVGGDGEVFHGADEVLAPLLDCAGFAVGLLVIRLFGIRRLAINPVEVRLQVTIGAGYVADFDGEEDVATVVGPARFHLNRLIVGEAARGLAGRTAG